MHRFLLFLSKTDNSIIRHCNSSTNNIQASLGFFVLLTGVLAFISGSLAVSHMFIQVDVFGKPQLSIEGWIFSCLIGFVYAVLIMAIDREIVAASTKWAILLRVPLAIIISIVISVPIEIQLFSGRINKKLLANVRVENERLAAHVHETMLPFERRRDTLLQLKNAAISQRANWGNIMDIEVVGNMREGKTRPAGKGNAYNSAKENKEQAAALIIATDSELVVVQHQLQHMQVQMDSTLVVDKIAQSFDLLSKYTALKEVTSGDASGSARTMGLGVTFLFLLFELVPSIMKLLLPKTEYDTLLAMRRDLNITAADTIFQEAKELYKGMGLTDISRRNPEIVHGLFQSQAK